VTDSEPYSPLFTCPPDPACEACVIVPARNEEATVEATLRALARQVDLDGKPLPYARYEVLLLLNNCTDRTAEVVARFAASHLAFRMLVAERTFAADQANVGFVRRQLMDEACARLFEAGHAEGAILSTDADTCVSPRWVAGNLSELARGADAVGGRIYLHSDEYESLAPEIRRNYVLELQHGLLAAEMEARLDPNPYDPWPRHYQHFCGSLAIRASAYRRVGGLPRVPHLEDMALYHELSRRDGRIRHSPLVEVRTSARIAGRSPVGLAGHLNELADVECNSRFVESAAFLEALLMLNGRLRRLWRAARGAHRARRLDLETAAGEAGVRAADLRCELARGIGFAQLMERLEIHEFLGRQWNGEGWTPMERAVEELGARLEQLRGPMKASSTMTTDAISGSCRGAGAPDRLPHHGADLRQGGGV
jgi:GT2 family glycosyltransferase